MESTLSTEVLNMELMDPSEQPRVFHLFSDLPKEIRLQVWEDAVPRDRLIHLFLTAHKGRRYELADDKPRYLERNALKKPISGERYRAVAEGVSLHSKFLRVNSESRAVALQFYRVHIPVYLTGANRTEKTALFFNPEHDFLHIVADAPVNKTLIDFVWDLKAYDPKDVGLLKLAVDLDSFCANDLQHLRQPDVPLIRQRTALVETLSQLKEVWFLNLHPTGLSRKDAQETHPQHPCKAFPVAGGLPTLERIGADPRGEELQQALGRICIGEIDPREIVFRWRRLLKTWEIEHEEGKVQYRVLFATCPGRQRRNWHSRRVKELSQVVESPTLQQHGPDVPAMTIQGGKDRTDGSTATAGFWLFPLESIGHIGEGENLADMDFCPDRSLDMRDHWPELVISKLS